MPPEVSPEEYARSFSETPGHRRHRGRLPRRQHALVSAARRRPGRRSSSPTRSPSTRPRGWHLIAPGNGVSTGADGKARWESPGAGGRDLPRRRPADALHRQGRPASRRRSTCAQPDPALASKYLDATSRYLRMYNELLGPYPYKKFALVENFWETGYGMPSYTLLGPADHPLSVHPHLVVPARDPPQLVGQLRVRRLRHRQLVRRPDRLPRRSPDEGGRGPAAPSTGATP